MKKNQLFYQRLERKWHMKKEKRRSNIIVIGVHTQNLYTMELVYNRIDIQKRNNNMELKDLKDIIQNYSV